MPEYINCRFDLIYPIDETAAAMEIMMEIIYESDAK